MPPRLAGRDRLSPASPSSSACAGQQSQPRHLGLSFSQVSPSLPHAVPTAASSLSSSHCAFFAFWRILSDIQLRIAHRSSNCAEATPVTHFSAFFCARVCSFLSLVSRCLLLLSARCSGPFQPVRLRCSRSPRLLSVAPLGSPLARIGTLASSGGLVPHPHPHTHPHPARRHSHLLSSPFSLPAVRGCAVLLLFRHLHSDTQILPSSAAQLALAFAATFAYCLPFIR